MTNTQKGGFTLVELIVVITILGVLSTIGFVSYTGYASTARDSVRLSDLGLVARSMEIFKTSKSLILKPENLINIEINGNIIGYQGDLGPDITGKLGITKSLIDPYDKSPYAYYINKNTKKQQFLGLLESPRASGVSYLAPYLYANDFSSRYPYYTGNSLGLMLTELNLPIHRLNGIQLDKKIDLVTGTHSLSYTKSVFDNNTQNRVRAFMSAGKMHLSSNYKGVASQNDCPENFIYVPGNKVVGQPSFCIGKYEASYGLNNRLETKPGATPATDIDYNGDTFQGCEALGNGYHNMTLNEWMTIARNIEQKSNNWSLGVVGEGFIKTGNSGNTTTGFSSTILPTGETGNSENDNKRQLMLSTGETIWDFVGNAWEVVAPIGIVDQSIFPANEILATTTHLVNSPTALQQELHDNMKNYSFGLEDKNVHLWSNIDNDSLKKLYGPLGNSGENLGLGGIRQIEVDSMYMVGGDSTEATTGENGLYSLWTLPYAEYDNVGTRCAYMPK